MKIPFFKWDQLPDDFKTGRRVMPVEYRINYGLDVVEYRFQFKLGEPFVIAHVTKADSVQSLIKALHEAFTLHHKYTELGRICSQIINHYDFIYGHPPTIEVGGSPSTLNDVIRIEVWEKSGHRTARYRFFYGESWWKGYRNTHNPKNSDTTDWRLQSGTGHKTPNYVFEAVEEAITKHLQTHGETQDKNVTIDVNGQVSEPPKRTLKKHEVAFTTSRTLPDAAKGPFPIVYVGPRYGRERRYILNYLETCHTLTVNSLASPGILARGIQRNLNTRGDDLRLETICEAIKEHYEFHFGPNPWQIKVGPKVLWSEARHLIQIRAARFGKNQRRVTFAFRGDSWEKCYSKRGASEWKHVCGPGETPGYVLKAVEDKYEAWAKGETKSVHTDVDTPPPETEKTETPMSDGIINKIIKSSSADAISAGIDQGLSHEGCEAIVAVVEKHLAPRMPFLAMLPDELKNMILAGTLLELCSRDVFGFGEKTNNIIKARAQAALTMSTALVTKEFIAPMRKDLIAAVGE